LLLFTFFEDEGRYKISVDEVTVNHIISCSLVAVSYVFSLFYVLNIMYPKEAALTLEFIQRYVLTNFFVNFIVFLVLQCHTKVT